MILHAKLSKKYSEIHSAPLNHSTRSGSDANSDIKQTKFTHTHTHTQLYTTTKQQTQYFKTLHSCVFLVDEKMKTATNKLTEA